MGRTDTHGSWRSRLPEQEDRKELSPRALGAMAEAVRRSREAVTRTGPGDPAVPPPPRPVASTRRDPSRPPDPPRRPQPAPQGAGTSGVSVERSLTWSVWVVAAAVLVAAVALGISMASHGSGGPSSPTAVSGTTTHPTSPATPAATPSHRARHRAPATQGSTPPAATVSSPAAPGSLPVLTSLSPPGGAPGQTLVISGANFLSSDGQIVARFGGVVTATSCPDQHTCSVTVPTWTGPPGTVGVTITTSAGTSNALNFAYS